MAATIDHTLAYSLLDYFCSSIVDVLLLGVVPAGNATAAAEPGVQTGAQV